VKLAASVTILSLAAASAVLSASYAARAADLPQAPPPQAPVAYSPAVPLYNWGGFYVGINGGWGWGGAKWTANTGIGNFSGTPDDNGGIVGGTLGYNFQSGGVVLGVEADFDYSAINTGTSSTICNIVGTCQTGNNWLSTVRGRFGYAWDRTLLYGTAGGVFGNVQTSLNGATTTHTQAGWTAGLGLEYAFAQNWTGKIEYLYANLGTDSTTVPCAACGAAFILHTGLTDNLFRVGVNYKFTY
jgi:outer membrane immunogenic protein